MAKTARHWATEALVRFHRENSYSNILLEEELQKAALPPKEQALATRLFYGVIERRLTLDYLIESCCSMKLKRMHPCVLDILRVGAYQLLFMEKIPASAAVNEAVNLTKRMGQYRAGGMVNGVLRSIDREAEKLLSSLPDTPEGWEKRYSCPALLSEYWIKGYGLQKARELVASINEIPPHYLRVNTHLTTTEQVTALLDDAGITYQTVAGLPDCLVIPEISLLKRLETLPKNWYYYQDIASQWSCLALDAKPGETIADVCAAPGGKSLTVSQYMQNSGRLLSCDIYDAKCDTIRRRAEEFGASVIDVQKRDASLPCAPQEEGAFDRVICDAPCSGLGVIRRKPEIRYKDPAEWAELPSLQMTILEASAAMVKVGGVLQYSTCTLNPAENEELAANFLKRNPHFAPRILPLLECFKKAGIEPQHTLTLFPNEQGSDGFFIAGFTRMG